MRNSRLDPATRRGILLIAAIVTAVASSAGCAGRSKPTSPPLVPPPLSAQIQYRPSSADVVSSTRPATIEPADALSIRAEWTALTTISPGLPPLLSSARIIESLSRAEPLRATGHVMGGSRLVPAERVDEVRASVQAAGRARSVAVASSSAVLPRGVAAAFTLAGDQAAAAPRIQVTIHRVPAPTTAPASAPGSAPQAAQEFVQYAVALDVPGGPSGKDEHERVLLEPVPLTLPTQFAVIIPGRFGGRSRAILSAIRIEPPADGPEQQERLARCTEDLQHYAASHAHVPAAATPVGLGPKFEAALAILREPRSTRTSLVYLANETGARLSGDVALAADDATLAELTRRINDRVNSKPLKEATAPQLAWHLEAACLEQLAAMQTAEQLPPELAAPLAVFAGEAGRRSASLDELLRAGSIDALRARLIAENFNYLEDSAPGSRVRAYDWLTGHGQLLDGYDPLGDAKQRRTALDQAITAAAKAVGGAK